MVTVGPDERRQLKEIREKLGLRQQDLATKIGAAPATISNMETGRHPQMRKVVYARLRRALKLASEGIVEVAGDDENYIAIVTGALDLDEQQQRAVRALIDSLRKKTGNT